MAFCKWCGKELSEGEACSCRDNAAPTVITQEVPVQAQQNKTAEEIKGAAANIWGLFTNLIKKPMTAARGFIASCDFKTALWIIAIQSVLTGLIATVYTGKYNSMIKSAAGLAGEYSDEVMLQIKSVMFSGVKVFFVAGITAFAAACALALLLMLFVKMFKGNTDYKYMLCVSAINSMIQVPFIAAGILLALIMSPDMNLSSLSNAVAALGAVSALGKSLFVPLCVATIGTALGYFVIAQSITAGSDVGEDATSYITFFAYIAMAIVLYIVIAKISVPACMPEMIKMGFRQGLDSMLNF